VSAIRNGLLRLRMAQGGGCDSIAVRELPMGAYNFANIYVSRVHVEVTFLILIY
jgi:hypothetical protein